MFSISTYPVWLKRSNNIKEPPDTCVTPTTLDLIQIYFVEIISPSGVVQLEMTMVAERVLIRGWIPQKAWIRNGREQ